MRIESIYLTKQVYENMGVGLPTLPMDPLSLRDLGQCVVVAGKNGSGKTRLFELIEQVSNKFISPETRKQVEFELAQARSNELSTTVHVEQIRKNGPRNGDHPGQLEQLLRSVANFRQETERLERVLAEAQVLKVWGQGTPKVVSFVPTSTTLGDPASLTDQQVSQLVSSFAMSLSAHEADRGAPAYARQIMRAAIVERARMNEGSSVQKNQQSEKELLELFTSLVGSDIKFELGDDMNLRLEGLTDKYSLMLSDGQKVLFQLACMLHSGHGSLKDCIVFLDEPENHLHPAVINDLVDRLLVLLSEGQLWIATHSVPLIAHLTANDPNCLWFAEDGKFRPAGRTPESVLDSLLGGPDGAKRVNELTLLPSRFSSSLFLRQCLLAPGVVGYSDGDAQLQQIRKELNDLRVDGQPLCIIDFGSGKGRLLDAIAQTSSGTDLSSFIDYLAYEQQIPLAEQCQRLCSSLYGADERTPRAFSKLKHLESMRGRKFADVAVVCNVLHEIHPDKWLEEFGEGSALSNLLKDEGYILFVEDYALPVGERAHEYGFLLLDQSQLSALFDISADDMIQKLFTRNDHQNTKYQGRLIAHLVSARCLGRMTTRTIWQAIQSLQDQSLDRLKVLLARENELNSGSGHGRESALVTQLVANSSLWLRDHPEHSTRATDGK